MENNDELMLPHDWTDIVALLNKNRKESLTDEEQMRLDRWLDLSAKNRELFEQTINSDWVIEELKRFGEVEKRMALIKEKLFPGSEELLTDESGARVSRIKVIRRFAIAASIIMILSIGAYYFLNKPEKVEVVETKIPANEIGQPARQKATLRLSNGQVLELDKKTEGILTRDSDAEITSKDGQLIYKNGSGQSGGENLFNVLTTGFGETYSMKLEENTTIFLNAGSRIRYPLTFGAERTVELEYGEVYLEVTRNKTPFVLKGGHGKIEVLGTRFNVRSYPDEPAMITSLLEGKVKLNHDGNESVVLIPGQQSVFNTGSKKLSVGKADVDGAASWVHGVLHFDNSNLTDVMRELGRWFSMDIEYRTSSNAVLHGDIERNIPLSELLVELEKLAHVKFKIEDKKIIVLP